MRQQDLTPVMAKCLLRSEENDQRQKQRRNKLFHRSAVSISNSQSIAIIISKWSNFSSCFPQLSTANMFENCLMIMLNQPCKLTSGISFYSSNGAFNLFLFISVALLNTASYRIIYIYLLIYSFIQDITRKMFQPVSFSSPKIQPLIF